MHEGRQCGETKFDFPQYPGFQIIHNLLKYIFKIIFQEVSLEKKFVLSFYFLLFNEYHSFFLTLQEHVA